MKGTMEHFEPGRRDFSLANAYVMATLSELAYSEPSEWDRVCRLWGFDDVDFFDRNGSQAGFARSSSAKAVVVSFRGTEVGDLRDLEADAKVRKIEGTGGRVHRGFLGALGEIWGPMRNRIEAAVLAHGCALWVTGHSLGGALARLASIEILGRADSIVKPGDFGGLYTFGCPRTGDADFCRKMRAVVGEKEFLVVNNNDVVADLPPEVMGYDHSGQLIYIHEPSTSGSVKISIDPSSWTVFFDRIRGAASDVGETGLDGIKDHALNKGGQGYVPFLCRAFSEAED